MQVYTLSGRVFFDYNGNGLQDGEEPGIQDVPVCIHSLDSALCSTSAPDGAYSIADVPAGSRQLYVKSPTDEPATAFRYINKFLGWVDIPAYEMNGVQVPAQHLADTEIQSINQPLRMTLGGDQSLDIALLQGFLTLPFSGATNYLLWSFVDLDYRVGHIRNYANESVPVVDAYIDINSPNAHSGTHDNHQGIDYNMLNGTRLLAMSNGIVIQERSAYHVVRIKHTIGSEVYVTGYEHNLVNLVSEGSYVRRGQIIALSGDWKDGEAGCQPHVHIHHWEIPNEWAHNPLWYIFEDNLRETIPFSGYLVQIVDDPYRDVLNPDSLSYWIVDNNPKSPF